MSSGRTLVVLPTYNEIDNLEPMTRAILAHPADICILVVDDGSPDGTGALADRLAAADPRISVVHRPHKMGLGTAYRLGFQRALAEGFDYVMEMDTDFSHDPAMIPRFLEEIQHYDLVLGSRYIPGGATVGWSRVREAISRGGSLYARLILGMRVRDLTGGFKCFRRQVLEALDLGSVQANGYVFQIEMTYRAWKQGFRIKEVPIIFRERRAGASKMSRRIVVEAMGVVWKLRLESWLHG